MSMRRDLTVYADEQWNDAFWLVRGPLPLDLTGKLLELYVRPRYDHSVLIRKLTTAPGGGIVVDNAPKGAAHIFVAQADVAANLPVGVWEQFLRLVNGPGDIEEMWRGTLTVRAGRVTG